MKKIITAICNPNLNEELKKQKNIEIVCKDIQYREAILEILEKNKDIDYIIISENIPGEINIEDLITKIKNINKKIKIIFLLKKENEKKEKILNKMGIKKIYFDKKINLNNLINILQEKELTPKNIEEKQNKEKSNIITISGFPLSGKTTITILLSILLIEKNKKILIINLNNKIEKRYFKLIKNKKNIFKDVKSEIKINTELYLVYNFLEIIKNKKYFIKTILRKYKKKYDYILVDIGNCNKKDILKEIYKNSNKNIIVTKGNISEIEKLKIILKKEKILNQLKKLCIIQNKYNFKSINSKIIKKAIKTPIKVYKIFYDKKYKYLIKIILKKQKINKIIKNYLFKIIN